MKKQIIALCLMSLSLNALAVDCVVQDDVGYKYDITLTGDVLDVVTNGAGWLLNRDAQQSTATTKYFNYQSLVVVSENNLISLYDYDTKNYYFQNQSCALPVSIKTVSAPPAGYVPRSTLPRDCFVVDLIQQNSEPIHFTVDSNNRPLSVFIQERKDGQWVNTEDFLHVDPKDANHYNGQSHGDFKSGVRIDPRDGSFTLITTESSGGSVCR